MEETNKMPLHPVFQESEIITLIMGIIGLVILWDTFKKFKLPATDLIKAAYLCILCSYLFTILEGIVYPAFFNLVEHLGYTLAGVFFAAACWRLTKQRIRDDAA
jgi:hypothetical protein